MEGAIVNLTVILIVVILAVSFASLYIGFKKKSGFIGLWVFLAGFIILGFLTYYARIKLHNDFLRVLPIQKQIVTKEGGKDLKTIKHWIEWQKEINKDTNKTILPQRRSFVKDGYKV